VPAIASSGEEALRRFARNIAFDLVLMDVRLQGEMDGIATAQALKDEFEIPVVYLTGARRRRHGKPRDDDRAAGLHSQSDWRLESAQVAVQIALYKHEMERRVRSSEAWLSTTLCSVGEGISPPIQPAKSSL